MCLQIYVFKDIAYNLNCSLVLENIAECSTFIFKMNVHVIYLEMFLLRKL